MIIIIGVELITGCKEIEDTDKYVKGDLDCSSSDLGSQDACVALWNNTGKTFYYQRKSFTYPSAISSLSNEWYTWSLGSISDTENFYYISYSKEMSDVMVIQLDKNEGVGIYEVDSGVQQDSPPPAIYIKSIDCSTSTYNLQTKCVSIENMTMETLYYQRSIGSSTGEIYPLETEKLGYSINDSVDDTENYYRISTSTSMSDSMTVKLNKNQAVLVYRIDTSIQQGSSFSFISVTSHASSQRRLEKPLENTVAPQ